MPMPLLILDSRSLLLADRHVLDNWKSAYEINRCTTSAETFERNHGAACRDMGHHWVWWDHSSLPQSNGTQGGIFWDIVFYDAAPKEAENHTVCKSGCITLQTALVWITISLCFSIRFLWISTYQISANSPTQ